MARKVQLRAGTAIALLFLLVIALRLKNGTKPFVTSADTYRQYLGSKAVVYNKESLDSDPTSGETDVSVDDNATFRPGNNDEPAKRDASWSLEDWDKQESDKLKYIESVVGDKSRASSIMKQLWKEDWASLAWVSNPDVIKRAYERQRAFLRDPLNYKPRPFIYRPILPGMGWGNLVYDISHHIIFALMLDRPFLMMLDRKDPAGKLGWNASDDTSPVLIPRIIDWRWGKPSLLKLFPPSLMSQRGGSDAPEHLSCRAGYSLHERCGGDQDDGNLESLLTYFRTDLREKVLYSEYSASFIRPLANAPSFRKFIKGNLDSRRSTLEVQMRFAFNMLFGMNATFRRERVFPHLALITRNFTTSFFTAHIRTGHMETGIARDENRLSDIRNLEECISGTEHSKSPWLVLTDDPDIAEDASSRLGAYTTVRKEGFSLKMHHVGYSPNRGEAWELAMRDWFLIIESTGPVLLRSRMPSAFSYGQRGAFIGGLSCSVGGRVNPLLRCGNKFFDELCVRP